MSTSDREQRENITEQGALDTDRRDFMKSSALAAGLLGAAGIAAAAQPAASAASSAAEDPKRPEKLGPRAMLDARFPVMYEDTVPNGVAVLTKYFKALSQRDMKAVAQTMQFPFGSYEGVEAVVVKTPEDLFARAPASMNMSENPERYTDHDGYMKAGCYDVFKGIEVLNWNPVSCAMSMTYDRYDKYGKRLHRCDGVYTVTNNDGHWGIEVMSTIFTPNDMVGVVYEDSMEAAKRTRRNHVLGGNFSPVDEEVNKTAYQPEGSALTISAGGTGGDFVNAPQGKMMDVYKIKGVKTRLRVIPNYFQGLVESKRFHELFKMTGVGNLGFVFANPYTRVIHHTTDKVHLWTGAARFTVAGEYVSMNTDLQIITYRKARWGNQGAIAYSQIHDRANDAANL